VVDLPCVAVCVPVGCRLLLVCSCLWVECFLWLVQEGEVGDGGVRCCCGYCQGVVSSCQSRIDGCELLMGSSAGMVLL
jgi:hypothetical protein